MILILPISTLFSTLSWQAALKLMDIELNFLTDIDQHLSIKEGIREWVTTITHQYTQANVLGMESYNARKRNSYIMYVDANHCIKTFRIQSYSSLHFLAFGLKAEKCQAE